MSFGLQISDRSGRLVVDTDTISWNVADIISISPGQSFNKNYTDLKDYEFMCSVMINGDVNYSVALSTPMPNISLLANGITAISMSPPNVDVVLVVMAR